MPNRRNMFFFFKRSEQKYQQVELLINHAEQNGFHIVDDYSKANIIASIGGDGTFLQAVRKTGFREDCLYIGINDSESPVLYPDFSINNPDKIVEAMMNEKIEVRRYPTIHVTIDNDTSFYCLNECTIRSPIIKTFVMDIFIDHFLFQTFRGDGMIISTPTGSTGYSKSVNGAIVDPMLPCLQVSELASLNNNSYRTLGSSFIMSGERKLLLKIAQEGNDHPVISLDNEAFSTQQTEKIEIMLGDRRIKTVKLKDNSFWEKVQRKFL